MRLLADLRDLFATSRADRLATAAIIRHLTALEDRPWAEDAQGHPLTPRYLATLLEGFGIKAKQIRQGADTRKGYLGLDFMDAFRRYLPANPKHPKHGHGVAELASHSEWRGPGAVSGRGHSRSPENTNNVSDVSGAPDENHGTNEV